MRFRSLDIGVYDSVYVGLFSFLSFVVVDVGLSEAEWSILDCMESVF